MRTLLNSISLLTANVIGSLASYLVVVLIARHLGAASFGIYTFAIAYAGFFVTIPNFGIDRILIRQISRDKKLTSEHLMTAGSIRLALLVVGLVIGIVVTKLLKYPASTQLAVLVLGLSLSANLFSELFRSVFYAFEAMPAESVMRAFGRTITVVAVAVAVYSGLGLFEVAVAILLTSLLEATAYGLSAHKRFGLHWVDLKFGKGKEMVVASLPLAINTVLVVAYFRLSVVVLTTLKGALAAGWFGAAFTFIQLLQLVSASVAGVALPILSRQQRQSQDQLLASLKKATYYLLLLAGPVSLVISFMARNLILTVYGPQFMPAVEALRLLIWASVFMFIGSIYGTALISLDKQRGLIAIGAIAVVVNLTTNFLAIPRWSYMGATLATLVTEASVAVLAYLLVSRILKGLSIHSLMLKPAAVTLVMAITMYMIGDWNWILQAIVATLVYVLAVVLIGAVQREDWQMLTVLKPARSVHNVI